MKTVNEANIIDFRVRVPQALFPDVRTPEENITQYDAVLNTTEKYTKAQTLEDLLTLLDENSIDHAVIHAEHEVGDIADALNRIVANIVEKYPDRFTGIGTISLENFSIKKALYQIDECAEIGFIGLSIEPAFFGRSLDDRQLYPIYAKAMEKNLLVSLHTGINYTTNCPISGENPILLDHIACDFPDLTLIAAHGGWPWIAEMVAVARKHPNIYMEFGGLAPKYIGAPGSGWEMMFRFMNSVLSDQVLYGTDWPTMDHQRTLAEWQDLPLKPKVQEKLFADNAKKLLGKHGAAK